MGLAVEQIPSLDEVERPSWNEEQYRKGSPTPLYIYVSGFRSTRQGFQQHAEFAISLGMGEASFDCWRRFSEFKALCSRLRHAPDASCRWVEIENWCAKNRRGPMDHLYLTTKTFLLEAFLRAALHEDCLEVLHFLGEGGR
ncbi:unnamed protein product [Phaeothamnion confervicola]